MATDLLFTTDLIDAEVQAALPEGYTLRPLDRGDYDSGFLDVLRVLTTVGDFSRAEFEERFDCMKKHEGTYYTIVVEEKSSATGQVSVVGCGTVIVERKL